MRILMTTDTVGGVWTYALDLAQALAAWSVDITLAAMGAPPSDDQCAQVAALPNVSLQVGAYKLEWMDDPWCDVDAAGQWLLALAGQADVDLVHLNGYAHGALPWGRPVLMVGHSCVLSWWQAVKGEAAPSSWSTYRERVTAGLHAADCVVAPTAAMLQTLQQHYGAMEQARVIYNGRAADRFHGERKAPFVFSAGRVWDEAKNIQALACVAPDLEWPVYVAGPAARPDGRPAASFAGINQLGRLDGDDLADWMNHAAVYALPARYEPFGLTALEAALAGCALVLGDIPTLREVWGDAAFYVPPDDTQALAETLGTLARRRTLCARKGAAARRRAAQFSLQHMGDRYYELYAWLTEAD